MQSTRPAGYAEPCKLYQKRSPFECHLRAWLFGRGGIQTPVQGVDGGEGGFAMVAGLGGMLAKGRYRPGAVIGQTEMQPPNVGVVRRPVIRIERSVRHQVTRLTLRTASLSTYSRMTGGTEET